jgi:hypothetical protein
VLGKLSLANLFNRAQGKLSLVKSLILFNLFLVYLSLGLLKSTGTTLYKDALNLGLVKSTLDVTDGNASEKMEKFTLSMSHESI